MLKKDLKNKVVIYQAKSGAIELKEDLHLETLWATQKQVASIFDIERSVATKHISNILKSKEINVKSNVQKMHIASSDKPVTFYSLDMILAVGYRANSGRAIQFRQWATKTLRSHILDGYTINRSRIAKNYDTFLKAVEQVKKLLPASSKIDNAGVLELIKLFASTWLSLSAYDKSNLPQTGATKKQVKLTATDLQNALVDLKKDLMFKKLTTEIFGQENHSGNLAGIVGNVMQSFAKKDVYPTLEEKAAHLLYFFIKNHPFVDGNKRSGAFAFVWFLQKSGLLNSQELTPSALTALTLLIAESNPKDKDKIIGVVLMLLKNK